MHYIFFFKEFEGIFKHNKVGRAERLIDII
jgi:hypothetical protein